MDGFLEMFCLYSNCFFLGGVGDVFCCFVGFWMFFDKRVWEGGCFSLKVRRRFGSCLKSSIRVERVFWLVLGASWETKCSSN